jgi:2-methylcitrate dehydratase PrpD
MSIARDFATVLTGLRAADLPRQSLENAAMLVASTLASAAAGRGIPSARIVQELARERGGTPEATVWFGGGLKLPVGDAARVNAIASDAAASDDSDLRNIMHCGTPLVSTALALAEHFGAPGLDVLTAIVIGYEAAGRMNDAVAKFRSRGFHGSSLTIFAVTVAAGRLLRLDVEKMTNAIALAATSASGLTKAAWTSVAREYNAGQAVINGVQAARSAERGFTAEELVLEGPLGFFDIFGTPDSETARRALFRDLGATWDIATDMAIKLIPGGHPFHAFAEAAARAAREAAVPPHQIERLIISRPGMAFLPEPIHPKDLVDMAHSPAYFAAAGAVDRDFTWAHASPEKIADPAIHGMIDRVVVGQPPTENPERYRQGATVTLQLADGRDVTATVYEPHGSAARDLAWGDVETKYRSLVPLAGLDQDQVERSLAFIRRLDDGVTVSPLVSLLQCGES